MATAGLLCGLCYLFCVDQNAIDLLTPMLEDQVDFVRQGALISMALVLQQTSEARSPSVKRFRELIAGIVADKHQPILAKSGAILAAGILDAGGGNVVLSMQSRAGFMKMVTIFPIALFRADVHNNLNLPNPGSLCRCDDVFAALVLVPTAALPELVLLSDLPDGTEQGLRHTAQL